MVSVHMHPQSDISRVLFEHEQSTEAHLNTWITARLWDLFDALRKDFPARPPA